MISVFEPVAVAAHRDGLRLLVGDRGNISVTLASSPGFGNERANKFFTSSRNS